MRIVSLTCSNTEIVCALGCEGMLVGVDNHSDFPVDVVNALPRVGPDLQIDIDKVAALKPDLVLASLTVPGHENVIAGLERAGLPFLAPEPISLQDVYRDIQDIASAIHVPDKGREVVDELQAGFDSLEQNTSQAKRPSIMVQWWPKPVIAPGRQSWIHDMIERAGGHNPLGHEECKSRPLEDSEVATLAPDAIVISWCGVKFEKYRPDVIYRNPTFANIPAIKNQRVYCISEEHMGRPSPRLLEGIQQLQAIVHECNQTPVPESTTT